jgi:AraC-like DNA-binding protein
VAYAQELMRRQPDAKISMVWTTSGFSTESTFFRAFKAVTGMTPNAWKSLNQHFSTGK